MRDLGTAVLAFGREGGGLSAEEVAAREQAAAERINQLVAASRPLAAHGSCASCGEPCGPLVHTLRCLPLRSLLLL